MRSKFSIGDIVIGKNEEPLVIPEMGINHEGSLEVAKLIVDAAYRSGAKIIKHQTHVVEDEMSHAAKNVIPGNSDVSIYDVMERCALSKDEEYDLMKYVESKGMVFLSTPFSRAAADRLEKFGVLAYKIGSGELNNYPLIEHIAAFGKPMILSTGMNDINHIQKAVNILEKYNVPFALMHTTNLYPTPPELVRLGAMQQMMETFPEILGANLVERHFIDDRKRPGPDVICSMNESELKELVTAAKNIRKMFGGKKEAAKEEQVTIDFAFATVVTIKNIKAGEIFTKENLWVKRPGTGEILAEEYKDILGKKAVCDIDTDTQLTRDMISK